MAAKANLDEWDAQKIEQSEKVQAPEDDFQEAEEEPPVEVRTAAGLAF